MQRKTSTGNAWPSLNIFYCASLGAIISLEFIQSSLQMIERNAFGYIVIYGLFLIAIGLPVLFCEMLLGKYFSDENNNLNTKRKHKFYKTWKFIAILGLVCSIILSAKSTLFTAEVLEDLVNFLLTDNPKADINDKRIPVTSYPIFYGTLVCIVVCLFSALSFRVKHLIVLPKLIWFCTVSLIIFIIYGLTVTTLGWQQSGAANTLLVFLHPSTIFYIDRFMIETAAKNAFYAVAGGTLVFHSYGKKISSPKDIRYTSYVVAISSLFFVEVVILAIMPLYLDLLFGYRDESLTLSQGHWYLNTIGQPFSKIFAFILCLLVIIAGLTTSQALMQPTIDYLKAKKANSFLKLSALLLPVVIIFSWLVFMFPWVRVFVLPGTLLVAIFSVAFIGWALPKRYLIAGFLPFERNKKKIFSPKKIIHAPGVISLVGGTGAFLASVIFSNIITNEVLAASHIISGLIFSGLFTISVFVEIYKWYSPKKIKGYSKKKTTLLIFWIKFVCPLILFYLFYHSIYILILILSYI